MLRFDGVPGSFGLVAAILGGQVFASTVLDHHPFAIRLLCWAAVALPFTALAYLPAKQDLDRDGWPPGVRAPADAIRCIP
jgi:hypothetical protein